MPANDEPFFSIVTITLNDFEGFRRTRKSIGEQTLLDLEWVVVDGASTDGTVAQLEACMLPYFRYVSERDG